MSPRPRSCTLAIAWRRAVARSSASEQKHQAAKPAPIRTRNRAIGHCRTMPSLPPCAAAPAICPPADKSANLQEKFVYCIVSTETEEEGHHADAEKRQGRPQPGIDQGRVAGRGYHGPQSGDPRQSAG